MNERMTIDEVSAVIGDSPQQIRVRCRYDLYDPPICRKIKKQGGKQYTYIFFRSMVMRYVGRENDCQENV